MLVFGDKTGIKRVKKLALATPTVLLCNTSGEAAYPAVILGLMARLSRQ